jgi:hypothetical protein
MEEYLTDNKTDAEAQALYMTQLTGAIDRLIIGIKGKEDNPNT